MNTSATTPISTNSGQAISKNIGFQMGLVSHVRSRPGHVRTDPHGRRPWGLPRSVGLPA
jgi:hypothetical protein